MGTYNSSSSSLPGGAVNESTSPGLVTSGEARRAPINDEPPLKNGTYYESSNL